MVGFLDLTSLACTVMWIGLEFGEDMAFMKQRVEDGFE